MFLRPHSILIRGLVCFLLGMKIDLYSILCTFIWPKLDLNSTLNSTYCDLEIDVTVTKT